jgi:hypothetical protein
MDRPTRRIDGSGTLAASTEDAAIGRREVAVGCTH